MQLDCAVLARWPPAPHRETLSRSISGDRITPFQHLQRAAFLQLKRQALPAVRASPAKSVRRALPDRLLQLLQPQPQHRQFSLENQTKPCEDGPSRESFARTDPAAPANPQPAAKSSRPPAAALPQQIQWPPKSSPSRKLVHSSRQFHHPVTHQALQSLPQVTNVLIKLAARLHHEFRRCRRRRCAHIRHKICNRKIRLVPHASDQRESSSATIARATASSLNSHKSSKDPPPRTSESHRTRFSR